MYSIFYICRGLKLPALNKAVSTTSSRLRTLGKKAAGGEGGTVVETLEDIKPLIIHKVGLRQGTPEKLVVNVETLSFRLPSGTRLQTAGRGKPLKPGNLCGRVENRGICRGGKGGVDDDSFVNVDDVKPDIKVDDTISTEDTKCNEWVAVCQMISLHMEVYINYTKKCLRINLKIMLVNLKVRTKQVTLLLKIKLLRVIIHK